MEKRLQLKLIQQLSVNDPLGVRPWAGLWGHSAEEDGRVVPLPELAFEWEH